MVGTRLQGIGFHLFRITDWMLNSTTILANHLLKRSYGLQGILARVQRYQNSFTALEIRFHDEIIIRDSRLGGVYNI